MTPQRLLESIPDNLLIRDGRQANNQRGTRLLRWLDGQGFHPSLLELEQERARRARRKAAA